MQTFITDHDMKINAQNLDSSRLGKQRVESNQIASTLLGISSGWKNHPAVRMWKGYEGYLINVYNRIIMDEWIDRGGDNTLSEIRWKILKNMAITKLVEKPPWITDEFILSHRSNLIQKYPEHYQPLWPDIEPGLPYVWPV